MIKGLQKSPFDIVLNDVKLILSPNCGNEARVSTLTPAFQHSPGNVSQHKIGKEIKGTPFGKEEIKLSPFKDGTIIYLENCKEPTGTKSPRMNMCV